MDASEIDYQSLYEGVVEELEQARLTILKMRYSRALSIDLDQLKDALAKNYILFATIASIGIILVCFVDVIYKIRRTRER